ncbi:MAG TPA: hypothetical protein DCY12_05505 [Candidatus Atribacteria bacterium]|nr:hypothetical protein [Candidatus Atribacteria bacterium]
MTYDFNYPTRWEKGILIECNDCKLDILKKINEGTQFSFDPKFRETILTFIIITLHRSFENNLDYPFRTRSQVIEILVKHGQFTQDEIEKIYRQYQYRDYTPEWEEDAKKRGCLDEDIIKYITSSQTGLEQKITTEPGIPVNFNLPMIDCHTKDECGLCLQTLEEVKCDDCQISILNTPENTDAYHNLVCPSCKKDLKKSGIPLHHGAWRNGEPIIDKVSTDYLAISHPNCPKRKDGVGEMYPIGVWVENSRLIVHLRCTHCGYEDALKFFLRDKEIRLLDSVYTHEGTKNFSRLKKIKFRTYDLLEGTESKTLEFKCSFYGLNDKVPPTPSSVKTAKKQIVDEIIGFLNTDGGVLLIGIEKDKKIIGIERDFQYIQNTKNGRLTPQDFFTLEFKELLQSSIHQVEKSIRNINLSIENLPTGECVVIIDVNKSEIPVFNKDLELVVNMIGAKKFYKKQEAINYIKSQFGDDFNFSEYGFLS